MDQRGGVIYSLILIQWRRRRSDRVGDNDVACAAQRWVTNDRRCVCVAPECPAGRKAHTHDRFDLSLFSWQICRPAKVSGISVQAKSSIGYRFNDQSLSLSFWFRDLSVLFTSQTLSLSGGGRLERKKRNLSFLLTERTIRHVNPLHFFPPIIHPCLRYYFRLLFFFYFFSQVGRNRCGTKRS